MMLCVFLLAIAPAAKAVSMEIFIETLSPYGAWHEHTDYGLVWLPEVDGEWAPYKQGSWAWTDLGWYWQSEEPWAWAVYHYGRWFRWGERWTWVPGDTWAPAWVNWSEDDTHVAWAPLGPDAGYDELHNGNMADTRIEVSIEYPVEYYQIVPIQYFAVNNVASYCLTPPYKRKVYPGLRRTTAYRPYQWNGGIIYGTYGPDYKYLSYHSNASISYYRVRESSKILLPKANWRGYQPMVRQNVLYLPHHERIFPQGGAWGGKHGHYGKHKKSSGVMTPPVKDPSPRFQSGSSHSKHDTHHGWHDHHDRNKSRSHQKNNRVGAPVGQGGQRSVEQTPKKQQSRYQSSKPNTNRYQHPSSVQYPQGYETQNPYSSQGQGKIKQPRRERQQTQGTAPGRKNYNTSPQTGPRFQQAPSRTQPSQMRPPMQQGRQNRGQTLPRGAPGSFTENR